MPFKFRFKVLLQHREYLLRKAQIALAAVQAHYDQIAGRKEQMRLRMEEHIRQWEEKQIRGMSIAEYLSFEEYLKTLEQHLLQIEIELKQAALEVEKAKTVLIDKERDHEVIETLEEAEKEAHRYLQMKNEIKGLDEVAAFQDYHHNHKT